MIRKCENGHFMIGDDFDECLKCESTKFSVIKDPEELMKLAERAAEEKRLDKATVHRLADESLYQRLRQLEPELADRYNVVRGKGFWYE